ncbi:hypothetical protein BDB00DRAFT_819710 [Zychaea mexicana]|uniref:uncharacterized protein n=1 Tax=Zychaea mexicana TaxID=64656 RepID=UPI0022FEDE2A|nr:uncharacterized protein BDB00DRAFT_819710 [Zychaea mexicana]KAI9494129.1 hypothetical protein BDB00DRAFT_819710 [Zychaea mexicana]
MANNPFEDNPWSNQAGGGPRFGNAYEDDPHNAWSSSNNGSTRMPSPSDYRASNNNSTSMNAWNESNKTEYPAGTTDSPYERVSTSTPTQPQDAYQFAGTRLGGDADDGGGGGGNAYSKVQVSSDTSSPSPRPPPTPAGGKPRPNQAEVEEALPPAWDKSRMNPNKWRLLLRALQLIAAIGHLGFAAGASPYSGNEVPFDSSACFYFLYAVAILTIIWAMFHLSFYCYRRVAHGNKMNRVLMSGIDLLLTILWGIGTIVEIAMFPCGPGDNNGWCDFYNVSIFWGMLSFALFIAAVGWDILGACVARRK